MMIAEIRICHHQMNEHVIYEIKLFGRATEFFLSVIQQRSNITRIWSPINRSLVINYFFYTYREALLPVF
jgi:hypothetical protein